MFESVHEVVKTKISVYCKYCVNFHGSIAKFFGTISPIISIGPKNISTQFESSILKCTILLLLVVNERERARSLQFQPFIKFLCKEEVGRATTTFYRTVPSFLTLFRARGLVFCCYSVNIIKSTWDLSLKSFLVVADIVSKESGSERASWCTASTQSRQSSTIT